MNTRADVLKSLLFVQNPINSLEQSHKGGRAASFPDFSFIIKYKAAFYSENFFEKLPLFYAGNPNAFFFIDQQRFPVRPGAIECLIFRKLRRWKMQTITQKQKNWHWVDSFFFRQGFLSFSVFS